MAQRNTGPSGPRAGLVLVIAFVVVVHGWLRLAGRAGPETENRQAPSVEATAPYQSEVVETPGTAIEILVDVSGSMAQLAPGSTRPKAEVARGALERMLAATDAFASRRPDYPIQVGIVAFNSVPREMLPLGPYQAAAASAALARLPPPGMGTAIGDALQAARVALYRSGAVRKYILVVTDGENTVSTPPERVAREIWRRSGGAVSISFVAFDTNPNAFDFLREVGGEVLPAADPSGLERALQQIYEGKILVEAADAGEATGRPR
jgi:Mg-chelatase subunit ChlD